jgi:hypothetical protein
MTDRAVRVVVMAKDSPNPPAKGNRDSRVS